MTPQDLGLPEKFKEFRVGQVEAIEYVLESTKRFNALSIPTGGGKSLAAISIALLNPKRTTILTSTRGLQDQYNSDFYLDEDKYLSVISNLTTGDIVPRTITDLRGKSNYQCQSFPKLNCKEGDENGCSCDKTCPSRRASATARASKIVITNYSKWLYENSKMMGALNIEGGIPTTLLILDEAHNSVEELSRFMNFILSLKECPNLPDYETVEEWKGWAHVGMEETLYRINNAVMDLTLGKPSALKTLLALRNLQMKLDKLNCLDPNDWVMEKKVGRSTHWYEFDCVWPGKYAERHLFAHVSKVLLISATVRPKTLALLGIPKQHYQFREWKREFPKYRCPVYHIPTARLSSKTWSKNEDAWISTIDALIESRLDRKGIIHTGSYARQSILLARSKYAGLMFANTKDPNSYTASKTVQNFRDCHTPCLLVSPSFGTGWDFPGDQCEYQIITKLPFPDSSTVLAKQRKKVDKMYALYTTAQELVQWCGRGMRFFNDRCETFIIDDHIEWFYHAVKGLIPSYFEVKRMGAGVIPKAPPKL